MSDVVVIGAGPAGMTAALFLTHQGYSVTVIDDQPAPGGRIFAGIETRDLYTSEDRDGAALVSRFRKGGGHYLSSVEAWQIEGGPRVYLSREGKASMVEPQFVLLATGAQERPMPFPGWQIPGVMTVGAAQLLLKTAGQIPDKPVWMAGSGPLLLLYAHQLITAGGKIAGILDTAPRRGRLSSLPLLMGALPSGWQDLVRGMHWMLEMRGIPTIRDVGRIEAEGPARLSHVRYATRGGKTGSLTTDVLLIHDGVIPAAHNSMAAGCAHQWNPRQECFEPVVDGFGGTSHAEIYVAGDGATIRGARMASVSGRLAAIGIARAAGGLTEVQASALAGPLRRQLAASARFRAYLDRLFPPSNLLIPDETMVCRCEEVSAGQLREMLAGRPSLGPDGLKSLSRAGMGPCQGRQCGLTLTRLIAETHKLPPERVGFLRIRPPLKPLTVEELASLDACS